MITAEALDFDNPLFDSRKLSFDGRKHESLSNQQISINPLARKGTLQRALSIKGGLGVSSRVHSASAGCLTSLDLNNATVISADDFKSLVQGLKKTEENTAVLARIRLCSNNKLFTSDQLLQLLDVTTSIKTQIEIISILAPNLTDPKSKFEQFVGRYRFAEDKDKVTEYLTDATKKLSSLRFSRHTSLSVRQSRFGSTDSLSGNLVDNHSPLKSRFTSTESNNNNNNVIPYKSSFYSGVNSPSANSPSTGPGVTEVDRELYKIDDSYREDSLQSIDCCVLSSSTSSTPHDNENDTNTVIIDAPSVADVKKRISAKLHASGNAHLLSSQTNLAFTPRHGESTKTSTKGTSSISSASPRPVSVNMQSYSSSNSSNTNTSKATNDQSNNAHNDTTNTNTVKAINSSPTKVTNSTATVTTTAAITMAAKDEKETNNVNKTSSPPSSPSSSPKREPFLSKLKSTFSPSTRKASTTATSTETTPTATIINASTNSSSSPSVPKQQQRPVDNPIGENDWFRYEEPTTTTTTDNTAAATTNTAAAIDSNNNNLTSSSLLITSKPAITNTSPSRNTRNTNNDDDDDDVLFEGLLLSKAGWVTKSWCIYRVKIKGSVFILCEEKSSNKKKDSIEYDLHPSHGTQLIIHCDTIRMLNKPDIHELKISGLIKKSGSRGINTAIKKELIVLRSVHTGYEESLQDLYKWKDYLLKANSSNS